MMRKVFLVLVGTMMAAAVLLLFFAGVGAFDAAPRAESFEPHRLVGRVLFGLSVLAIVVAALARVPGRLIGLTALVTGLVVVQSLIAVIAGGIEEQSQATGNLVFGLHAVNGLITMGVIHTVLERARALARRPGATPAPVAEPASVPGSASPHPAGS